jgi:hypothetical protein
MQGILLITNCRFCRRREHAVGRIASLGMAADIVGEVSDLWGRAWQFAYVDTI